MPNFQEEIYVFQVCCLSFSMACRLIGKNDPELGIVCPTGKYADTWKIGLVMNHLITGSEGTSQA